MPDPSRPRGQRKRENTRRQLLAAGLRVLERKGEALAASDVTDEADVAVGTFYNYFADRDALIDAITEEQIFALSAAVATAETADADPALRVAQTAAVVLRRASTDEAWGRLVLRLVTRPTLYNRINGYLRDDLAGGLAQGRFDSGPSDETLDQLLGLLVMTIRRIVAGVAETDAEGRAVARALRALGIAEPEAQALATTAVERASAS